MFVVTSLSALDDLWEERDKLIEEAAGRASDSAGAACRGSGETYGTRDHQWKVKTFEMALSLKERLDLVEGVRASIREDTTHKPKGRK